jgi:hypothetical protein
VPTIRRDLKARPAMISSSDIGISTEILDLRESGDKPGEESLAVR